MILEISKEYSLQKEIKDKIKILEKEYQESEDKVYKLVIANRTKCVHPRQFVKLIDVETPRFSFFNNWTMARDTIIFCTLCCQKQNYIDNNNNYNDSNICRDWLFNIIKKYSQNKFL
jgi:hypothetical protein